MPPVITIDGPSGTGKGTLAHHLAITLGWHFLDSGALYRIVAVGAEKAGISFEDADKISEFANLNGANFIGHSQGFSAI